MLEHNTPSPASSFNMTRTRGRPDEAMQDSMSKLNATSAECSAFLVLTRRSVSEEADESTAHPGSTRLWQNYTSWLNFKDQSSYCIQYYIFSCVQLNEPLANVRHGFPLTQYRHLSSIKPVFSKRFYYFRFPRLSVVQHHMAALIPHAS
jgi:hypothetical protein